MSATTPLLLVASAALLLATAGCNADKIDSGDLVPPAAASALAVPPLGQELFRMFDAQKTRAAASELPPQF